MGRPKKSAPAPVELEPEEISQEEPDEESASVIEPEDDDEPEAGGKAISKAAAVRDALEQGEDSPDAGVAYVKKVHGIDISNQMFSSYKAQEKARQAKKAASGKPAKPGRKPREASPEPAAAPSAPASRATPAASNGDIMGDLAAVKALVNKLGAEQVRKIVGLFE